MEDKRKSFLDEKGGAGQGSEVEAGDELDAYMSGLSSQLGASFFLQMTPKLS